MRLAVDAIELGYNDIRPDPTGRPARVRSRQLQGADLFYQLELSGGEPVGALLPSRDNYAIDETVGVILEADHLVLFDPAWSAVIEANAASS